MKKLTLLLTAFLLFALAVPALACGGGDKKDKDEKAFTTTNAQSLCSGDKGNKPAPDPQCGGGCDKKDKEDTKA